MTTFADIRRSPDTPTATQVLAAMAYELAETNKAHGKVKADASLMRSQAYVDQAQMQHSLLVLTLKAFQTDWSNQPMAELLAAVLAGHTAANAALWGHDRDSEIENAGVEAMGAVERLVDEWAQYVHGVAA